MTEKYITFETAKLAKLKGFNWVTNYYYDTTGDLCSQVQKIDWNQSKDGIYSRPTQDLLKKWLREVKNIHVNPVPYNETADRSNEVTGYYVGEIMTTDGKMVSPGDGNYSTYEGALEKGLQIGLNHID